MSKLNIFQDPTKSVPRSDGQIVRVTMEENQIGGRKDNLPAQSKSDVASIVHVPSQG